MRDRIQLDVERERWKQLPAAPGWIDRALEGAVNGLAASRKPAYVAAAQAYDDAAVRFDAGLYSRLDGATGDPGGGRSPIDRDSLDRAGAALEDPSLAAAAEDWRAARARMDSARNELQALTDALRQQVRAGRADPGILLPSRRP